MPYKDAFWLLSKVLFTYIVTVIPQHSPCQIQSFYARQFGSGQGNLLRVHLNQNDVPTNVTFTGSCVNATLGFTEFTEDREAINGSLAVSIRWAVNSHYVLAVHEGDLVIKFAPFENHWFILTSCDECYEGLNILETSSTPRLYVKSASSGIPFLDGTAGPMAWLAIMPSACS